MATLQVCGGPGSHTHTRTVVRFRGATKSNENIEDEEESWEGLTGSRSVLRSFAWTGNCLTFNPLKYAATPEIQDGCII